MASGNEVLLWKPDCWPYSHHTDSDDVFLIIISLFRSFKINEHNKMHYSKRQNQIRVGWCNYLYIYVSTLWWKYISAKTCLCRVMGSTRRGPKNIWQILTAPERPFHIKSALIRNWRLKLSPLLQPLKPILLFFPLPNVVLLNQTHYNPSPVSLSPCLPKAKSICWPSAHVRREIMQMSL